LPPPNPTGIPPFCDLFVPGPGAPPLIWALGQGSGRAGPAGWAGACLLGLPVCLFLFLVLSSSPFFRLGLVVVVEGREREISPRGMGGVGGEVGTRGEAHPPRSPKKGGSPQNNRPGAPNKRGPGPRAPLPTHPPPGPGAVRPPPPPPGAWGRRPQDSGWGLAAGGSGLGRGGWEPGGEKKKVR